jgi:hypothetical protein
VIRRPALTDHLRNYIKTNNLELPVNLDASAVVHESTKRDQAVADEETPEAGQAAHTPTAGIARRSACRRARRKSVASR